MLRAGLTHDAELADELMQDCLSGPGGASPCGAPAVPPEPDIGGGMSGFGEVDIPPTHRHLVRISHFQHYRRRSNPLSVVIAVSG